MSPGKSSIDDRSESVLARPKGKLLRDLIRGGHSFSGHERHCLFLNTGNSRFANVSALSGLDLEDDGRAAAAADWDSDGDLDFWIVNRSGPQVRFLRNTWDNNQFLSLKLRGTTSNRDAIGARVQLSLSDGRRLTKTVRAGEGYLSQTSKSLHFGLGQQEIRETTIVWPDGSQQHFDQLQPNHRYVITQGNDVARPRNPTRRYAADEKKATVRSRESDGRSRVVITSPVPVPNLTYQTDTGANKQLDDAVLRQPVLINLWASWCQPCLQELSEFRAHADQIRAANLRIVALSIEDEPRFHLPGDVNQYESGVFDFGKALPSLLDQLQLLHDNIFDLHGRLTLPGSFLIDSQRRLAVMYQGPVAVDQLISDVKQLHLQGQDRREIAMPFRGRWSTSIRNPRLMLMALDLLAHDQLDETLKFLEANRSSIAGDEEFHILLFNIGQAYTKRKEHASAIRFYQQAIKLRNDLAPAHFNLGVTYALSGEPKKAIGHFRRAVQFEPASMVNRVNMAKTLIQLGQVKEATEALAKALSFDPTHAPANYEMAIALMLRGRVDPAIEHYGKALATEFDNYSGLPHWSRFKQACDLTTEALASTGPEGKTIAKTIKGKINRFREAIDRTRNSTGGSK